jgi:hypothetical protein
MKFPKMVYLAKDNYRIVQNEIELEEAYNKGFCDHWLDCGKEKVEIISPIELPKKVNNVYGKRSR